MRSPSPSRRTAGLLAVTAIGVSTAVLSLTGTASAAELKPFSFTTAGLTADSSTGSLAPTDPGTLDVTVPAGYCGIGWVLTGGSGGEAQDGTAGAFGGQLALISAVEEGDVFTLVPGLAGADAPGAAGGVNAEGHDGADGTAGGGGGGAASEVLTEDGASYLLAYGGDGADGATGNGGAGYGDQSNLADEDISYLGDGSDDANGEAEEAGDGVVIGVGVPCAVPDAPQADSAEAGDGTITVRFFPPVADYGDEGGINTDDNGIPREEATGYEASVDGGDTWVAIDTTPGTGEDEARYGVVPDLTNGTSYDVQVRATSVVGPSEASDPVTATPLAVIGAPTDVAVAVGPSSIVLTWAPPVDDAVVTGYEAWALPGAGGQQSSQGMVMCEDLDADARSCVLAVEPGQQYSVGVAALGTGGARSDGQFLVTDVVPAASAPSAVPAADGALSTDEGAVSSVVPGATVTLEGAGYLPGSTVGLFIYSTPTALGTVVADENGAFSAEVTVPESFDGVHNLVAAGVDPDGNPRYLVLQVTVAADGTSLAYTGFSPMPFVGAGVLALLAGGGLLVASRRRA